MAKENVMYIGRLLYFFKSVSYLLLEFLWIFMGCLVIQIFLATFIYLPDAPEKPSKKTLDFIQHALDNPGKPDIMEEP